MHIHNLLGSYAVMDFLYQQGLRPMDLMLIWNGSNISCLTLVSNIKRQREARNTSSPG